LLRYVHAIIVAMLFDVACAYYRSMSSVIRPLFSRFTLIRAATFAADVAAVIVAADY